MKKKKERAPSEQTVFRRRIIEIERRAREEGAAEIADKLVAALEEMKALRRDRQRFASDSASDFASESLVNLPPLVKEEEKEKKQKNKEEENDTPASYFSGESNKKENEGEPKTMARPTLEECQAYNLEKNLRMDVEHFFDYFSSNGWKVGGRAPMKDWRAAMRNWARNQKRVGANTRESHNQPVGFVYHQPGYKPNFERAKPVKLEDL